MHHNELIKRFIALVDSKAFGEATLVKILASTDVEPINFILFDQSIRAIKVVEYLRNGSIGKVQETFLN